MVTWGAVCLKNRAPEAGAEFDQDCVCEAGDQQHAEALRRNGFVPESIRSLQLSCCLDEVIPQIPLPPAPGGGRAGWGLAAFCLCGLDPFLVDCSLIDRLPYHRLLLLD